MLVPDADRHRSDPVPARVAVPQPPSGSTTTSGPAERVGRGHEVGHDRGSTIPSATDENRFYPAHGGYQPRNTGDRRSAKAARPSRQSSVPVTSSWATDSSHREVARSDSRDRLVRYLAIPMALVGPVASLAAQAAASSSSSARGTTRLTSPSRSASRAGHVVPEEEQLLGLLGADEPGQQVGAAGVGGDPPADEHLDELGLLRRQHQVAGQGQVHPAAGGRGVDRGDDRLLAVEDGADQALPAGADESGGVAHGPVGGALGPGRCRALRTAGRLPCRSPFSPAPVSTTTRTARSAEASSSQATICSRMAAVMALPASGRLRVIQATPSSIRRSTASSPMPARGARLARHQMRWMMFIREVHTGSPVACVAPRRLHHDEGHGLALGLLLVRVDHAALAHQDVTGEAPGRW